MKFSQHVGTGTAAGGFICLPLNSVKFSRVIFIQSGPASNMKFLSILLIITDSICATVVVQRFDISYGCINCQPEQIHLSYGGILLFLLTTYSSIFTYIYRFSQPLVYMIEHNVDTFFNRIQYGTVFKSYQNIICLFFSESLMSHPLKYSYISLYCMCGFSSTE